MGAGIDTRRGVWMLRMKKLLKCIGYGKLRTSALFKKIEEGKVA